MLFFSPISMAQANQIDDFSAQYQTYNQTNQEFSLAKKVYLKNQTLAAKNDLIEKSQNLLLKRSQIFHSYFLALRFKLHNTGGISAEEIDHYTDKLNQEIDYLESNIQQLQNLSDPTLDQIKAKSTDFEERQDIFQRLSYQTLSTIEIGKINELNQDLENINKKFEPYIDQSTTSYLNNWYQDSQNGYVQVNQKISESKEKLDSMEKANDRRLTQVHSELNSLLEKSKIILLKSLGFHREIINQLNQDLVKNE